MLGFHKHSSIQLFTSFQPHKAILLNHWNDQISIQIRPNLHGKLHSEIEEQAEDRPWLKETIRS